MRWIPSIWMFVIPTIYMREYMMRILLILQ
jgi:hypothetical protein